MDPNTALTNILRGFEVADHIGALRRWLHGGGFAPKVGMPHEPDPFFADHCDGLYGDRYGSHVRVMANELGIWTSLAGSDWRLAASWFDLQPPGGHAC